MRGARTDTGSAICWRGRHARVPRVTLAGAAASFRPPETRRLHLPLCTSPCSVIPEFDTPAHSAALTNAYPSIAATAYDSNNNSFVCLVDPSREATFDLLAGVWRALAAMFPDPAMVIGGDEWWDCWSASPAVATWMAQQGMNATETYFYYERRMIDIARSLNKTSIAWLDVAVRERPQELSAPPPPRRSARPQGCSAAFVEACQRFHGPSPSLSHPCNHSSNPFPSDAGLP
jgi:hypothetical protein